MIAAAWLLWTPWVLAAPPAVAAEPEWPFVQDRILAVEVTMAPADFDRLRQQTRTEEESPWGRGCLAPPRPHPYTYFPADLVIDGREVPAVMIRKKGMFGSQSTTRPSFKVHLSKRAKGRRLAGLKKLTLNNAVQDPALVRQCLGYRLFRRAGVPAPRCGLARVKVNGRSLGVYANVESIDKGFALRHLGAGPVCLFEGAVSDLRPAWLTSFEHKTGDEAACRASLAALAAALELPDEGLLPALEAQLDLDEFLAYWALEWLVHDTDGYPAAANNYFVLRGPDGRWRFVPWGIDGIMQAPDEEVRVPTYGALAYRLWWHPEGRRRFLARVSTLLEPLLPAGASLDGLVTEGERLEGQAWPWLTSGQRRAMPAAGQALTDFICRWPTRLGKALALDTRPEWQNLPDPPCRPAARGGF